MLLICFVLPVDPPDAGCVRPGCEGAVIADGDANPVRRRDGAAMRRTVDGDGEHKYARSVDRTAACFFHQVSSLLRRPRPSEGMSKEPRLAPSRVIILTVTFWVVSLATTSFVPSGEKRMR